LEPAATGRPSYHPSVLLKLYIYGYLSRVQSSRRLKREAMLATASVAIDGSKFKAVNNRDRNFTRAKVERRGAQLEESVARYLSQLETADRQEPTEALAAKVTRLNEKLAKVKEQMGKLAVYEKQMLASPDQQISLTDLDSRSMATSGRGSGVVDYNVQVAVDTNHRLIITHEVTISGATRQYGRAGKGSIADRYPRGRCRSRLLQQPGDPCLLRSREPHPMLPPRLSQSFPRE
jgi:hypothetical protein